MVSSCVFRCVSNERVHHHHVHHVVITGSSPRGSSPHAHHHRGRIVAACIITGGKWEEGRRDSALNFAIRSGRGCSGVLSMTQWVTQKSALRSRPRRTILDAGVPTATAYAVNTLMADHKAGRVS